MFLTNGFLPMPLRAPDDGLGAAAPSEPVPINARDAVGALQALREKNSQAEAPAQEQPAKEENSAPAADATPAGEQTSGETEQANEPADEPPIDPPRSWTKEDKAIWPTLPREHQQRLLDLDRARELEVRRGQNEAAEQRKAAEAERKAAETERQKYEAALPNLQLAIQNHINTEFQDIKTWDDVRTMQRDDPMRFQQWQIAREQAIAVQNELQQANARLQADQEKQFEAFKVEQTKLFLEKAPEYADPAKSAQLQIEARALFDDVGLTGEEIEALSAGKSGISIHDYRAQLIIRDALRFRAAQKAAKAAPLKPVPPVQRPGTASLKGERASERVAELTQKLERTGSVRDAVALLKARRA